MAYNFSSTAVDASQIRPQSFCFDSPRMFVICLFMIGIPVCYLGKYLKALKIYILYVSASFSGPYEGDPLPVNGSRDLHRPGSQVQNLQTQPDRAIRMS